MDNNILLLSDPRNLINHTAETRNRELAIALAWPANPEFQQFIMPHANMIELCMRHSVYESYSLLPGITQERILRHLCSIPEADYEDAKRYEDVKNHAKFMLDDAEAEIAKHLWMIFLMSVNIISYDRSIPGHLKELNGEPFIPAEWQLPDVKANWAKWCAAQMQDTNADTRDKILELVDWFLQHGDRNMSTMPALPKKIEIAHKIYCLLQLTTSLSKKAEAACNAINDLVVAQQNTCCNSKLEVMRMKPEVEFLRYRAGTMGDATSAPYKEFSPTHHPFTAYDIADWCTGYNEAGDTAIPAPPKDERVYKLDRLCDAFLYEYFTRMDNSNWLDPDGSPINDPLGHILSAFEEWRTAQLLLLTDERAYEFNEKGYPEDNGLYQSVLSLSSEKFAVWYDDNRSTFEMDAMFEVYEVAGLNGQSRPELYRKIISDENERWILLHLNPEIIPAQLYTMAAIEEDFANKELQKTEPITNERTNDDDILEWNP